MDNAWLISSTLLISSIILIDFGCGQTAGRARLFQCKPSSDRSGQVYTPDIPDFYFNALNAANFTTGPGANLTTASDEITHIFTIPPELVQQNCAGNVVAIQYCYSLASSIGDNVTAFNFLLLNRNGLEFTVTGSFMVHTIPRRNFCTNLPRRICCDTATLVATNRFQLLSTGYTFAVTPINNNVSLLSFADAASYRYRHLRASLGSFVSPGDTFSLDRDNAMFLLLLRFLIEPNVADTTEPESVITAVPSSSSGLIGGVVGGLIVAVLLMTAIVFVMTMLLIHRSRKHSISSAIDSGDTSGSRISDQRAPDYADVGPGAHSEAAEIVPYTTGSWNYEYAMAGASSLYSVATKEDSEEIYELPVGTIAGLLRQIRAKIITRDSIDLGNRIGSGEFGTVHKGVWVSSNGEMEVAVKTLKEGSEEEDRVKFLQEAAIMGQFKHPNVVEMYGVVTQGEPVLLALELLPKGDLRNFLMRPRSAEESVDDHALLSYCRQVASGMAYLSSKAFVHRDLAARNILVSEDEICKIADFGMSRDLMDESYYVSHGGKIPVKWTAPEALHYKKYSTASDVWSFGVLMYEIWSMGHKPFEDLTNIQALKLVDTGYRLAPPPGCPRALYSIMISCWNPDTVGRTSFFDLTRQLSLPDTKLLKWSEEDKSVHPEAAQLGADLLCGEELYKDLQVQYKPETDY